MKIVHDIVAAVSGPGWKYGLSRILVNEDNEGAVFIAGSETPLVEFTVEGVSTSRGTGLTADGGEVTWRRRGSSCQYKLAKCKVNTETMTSWWVASRETETAEVEEPATESRMADTETTEGIDEPDSSRGDVVEGTPEDGATGEIEEVVVEKPKRKRRTKAEIEADKAAAEAKKLEDLL